MEVVQVALAEVVMLLRVEHMGSDVSVGSGLACYAPHNEAEKHESGRAMLQIAGTLDGHSSACHAPMVEQLVHGTVDELQICLVTHHTTQLMALLDHMPRPRRAPVYSKVGKSVKATACSGSDLEVLGHARVLSCREVP
jgi:hypothetical protein